MIGILRPVGVSQHAEINQSVGIHRPAGCTGRRLLGFATPPHLGDASLQTASNAARTPVVLHTHRAERCAPSPGAVVPFRACFSSGIPRRPAGLSQHAVRHTRERPRRTDELERLSETFPSARLSASTDLGDLLVLPSTRRFDRHAGLTPIWSRRSPTVLLAKDVSVYHSPETGGGLGSERRCQTRITALTLW